MALREISNLLPGASVTGTSLLTSPRGAYPFPVKTPGAKSKSAKRQSLGGASLSHLYGGSGGGNDNRVLQLEAKLMCEVAKNKKLSAQLRQQQHQQKQQVAATALSRQWHASQASLLRQSSPLGQTSQLRASR